MFYVPLVFVYAVALFTGLSIIILVLSIFTATFYPHKEISTKTFYLNVLPDCRSPKLFQIKLTFALMLGVLAKFSPFSWSSALAFPLS